MSAITGAVIGTAMGFYLTLGIVVLKARFDIYIYAMHDLTEFRWDTLPIILGLVIGARLGYRIPIRSLRAVLRGVGAAMICAIIGAMIWRTGPEAWTAATFLSAVALVVGTGVALYVSAEDGFRIPDLAVGAFVLLVAGFAVVQGLRDPEAVESVDVAPQPLRSRQRGRSGPLRRRRRRRDDTGPLATPDGTSRRTSRPGHGLWPGTRRFQCSFPEIWSTRWASATGITRSSPWTRCGFGTRSISSRALRLVGSTPWGSSNRGTMTGGIRVPIWDSSESRTCRSNSKWRGIRGSWSR